jgi:hypothetical protein
MFVFTLYKKLYLTRFHGKQSIDLRRMKERRKKTALLPSLLFVVYDLI